MEFRVLGPVEIWSDDTRLDAGHVKQQSVLAVLLLDLGRVVPIDLLIDRVWADSPPTSVRNSLYAYVARLRAAIATAGDKDVMVTRRRGGYALHAEPDRVDLYRFRRLVSQASAEEDQAATRLLSDALGLWRGPALSGLTSPWLRAMRDTLELQRVGAVLGLGELSLRHGDHVVLSGRLATEAIAHPADERLIGQLMLALYRSGRQSEALHWYEQARRHLAEELGADPGPVLVELRRQILHGDPVLAEPVLGARGRISPGQNDPPVPRQLPAAISAFTGRSAELADLDCLASGPAPVVISAVSGTAGVGKTSLAVHWAHKVACRFPDGQLYANLRGYDPGKPMSAPEVLAGFLRALGVANIDIPLDEGERAARYRSLLAGKRMLVLLDNAGGAEQVRPLLPGASTCLTIVTSRDSLAGLVARDGARRLDLELLPLSEAVDLLAALIGARVGADGEAAIALARACARLPLALRVAAELVVSRPAGPLSELASELTDQQRRLDLLGTSGDVRTAVRGVFSWSCRHLLADEARTFRLLGLHPTAEVDLYAAAALLGVPVDQASNLLGRLVRAHLIQPLRSGWFSTHDLLRSYAAELASQHDSDADRRQALSRLFDHYLCTAARAMDMLYPAERPVRPDAPLTATATPSLDEPGAAKTWLDTHRDILVAVAARMATGWPGQADRLVAIVFRHLDSGGHFHQVAAGYLHAYQDAHSRVDLAAESEALTGLATADWRLGRYFDAERHLRQALALCRQRDDRPGEARALGTLGNVVSQQGCYEQALSYYQQALSVHEQTGHLVDQASALGNIGDIDLRQGRYDRAARHHRQALDLIRQVGNRLFEVCALTSLGEVDLRRGRYDDAASALTQALAMSRQTGNRSCEGYALTRLGELDLKQGRHERAASQHREALGRFRDIGDRSGEACALRSLADVLLATGQPQHASALCECALRLARQIGDRYEQARALDGLARASNAVAESAKARSTWQEAIAIYAELGAPEVNAIRTELTRLAAQDAEGSERR